MLMATLPFQLSITNSLKDNQAETVNCVSLLRAIADRREVYSGLWNSREVVIKIFLDKLSAKRHLKREWRRLTQLKNREVNCPQPLFFGKIEKGDWAIVVEKIIGCSSALDVFEKASSKSEKLDLLIMIAKELAKQHSKGVLQRDLHFGNFLLKQNRIYTIDPAQIYFSNGEIGKKKSLSQLAKLASCLGDDEKEAVSKLCEDYMGERGWPLESLDRGWFSKHLTALKKRGVRRGLKKFMRTSRRYVKIKDTGFTGMIDRCFCEVSEPFDFIKQIDVLMDSGEILKKGNTSYVSRLNRDGKDIVIKRYNHKGIAHSLRHTIKVSRGRRNWLNGHRLAFLDITAAKPLAFIEQRKGPLLWKSYIVTEFIEGQSLYSFLKDESIDRKQKSEMIAKIEKLLNKMSKYNIAHGDMKHSNILISADEPVLIDLDGMRVYKWGWLCRRKQARDAKRFMDCRLH